MLWQGHPVTGWDGTGWGAEGLERNSAEWEQRVAGAAAASASLPIIMGIP